MKSYSQFVLNDKFFEDHLEHLQPSDQKDQRDKLAAKACPEDVHVAQVLPTRVPEESSNLNSKLFLWCKLSKLFFFSVLKVPIGLPKLDTKWIMARRKVLCSGVEISVMKAAIPILRLECGKFSQYT